MTLILQRKRVKWGMAVPWDMEGAVGNRCIPIPFPAAVPGHIQDLPVQGPHCTGLSRSLYPWVQGLVRGALVNQAPKHPEKGEQTVLGLGFTSPWSVPCGINGYFLPVSFSLRNTNQNTCWGASLFPFHQALSVLRLTGFSRWFCTRREAELQTRTCAAICSSYVSVGNRIMVVSSFKRGRFLLFSFSLLWPNLSMWLVTQCRKLFAVLFWHYKAQYIKGKELSVHRGLLKCLWCILGGDLPRS